MDIGQLWITLGVNAAGLNVAQAAITRFQQSSTTSMDRTAAALDRTSIRLQRFGSMATMYLSLPLIAAGTGALKLASDLEFATQKTVALAGVSQSQMNAWQSDITRIGNLTNRTAKEIAEALYYTASAGIKTQEAMDIVEMSAKGAASGLGDTDVIARFLTYSFNAYGKEAMKSARVMDILSVAVREGTAEASSMVGVMGDVLPVASAMGVPIDEVAASMAAMTRTGFNAAKSATALRQIMVSLLHPSAEATSTLNMMSKATGDTSISVEGLRKSIRDDGLLEALIKVDKLTQQFGEATAGIVFGNVRALTGDLSLVGAKLEENRKIFAAAKNETGVFANAFGIMTDTMQFKLGTVKKAVEQAFIGLGNSMMSPVIAILKDLVSMLKNLTTWYTNLSQSTQNLILWFAKWLALLGPLTIAISLVIRMYTVWRMVILGLIPAIRLLGTLMLAMPFIQYAVAIGLLVGLIYSMISASNELSETQKILNSVNATASQSIVDERVKLEQLLRIAQSDTASKKQRAEAIKTINAISPEYLSGVNQESILYGSATTAIQNYLSTLRDKAKLQAATNALIEEEKRRIQELATGQDREIGAWHKITSALDDMWNTKKKGTAQNKLENETAKTANEVYQKRVKILQDIIDGINGMVKEKEKEQPLDKLMTERNTTAYKYRDVLQEINDKVRESISLKSLQNSYIDPNIDADKAAKIAKAAADARNKQEEEGAKRRAALEASTTKIKAIEDIWKNYNEGLQVVQEKTKLFGETIDSSGKKFDSTEAYASLYATTLDSLLKYYDASDPALKKLIANLDRYRGTSAFAEATMRDLKEQLGQVDTQYKQSGDKVQWLTEKLELFSRTSKTLSIGGISGGKDVDYLKNSITGLTKELTGENLNKSLADAAIRSSLLGGSFDALGAKTVAYNNQLDALVLLYNIAKQNNDEFTMALVKNVIKTDQAEISTLNLASAMKAYKDATNLTNTSSETFGRNFDFTNARIKDTENLIQTLNAQLSTLKGNNQNTTETQLELNKALETLSTLNITKATQDYSKALEANGIQAKTTGKQYNLFMENLKAQVTWLKEVRSNVDVTSAEYANLSDKVIEAEGKLGKSGSAGFRKGLSALNDTFNQFTSAYSSMLEAKQTRALAMIDTTAKALNKSDVWVLKEKEKIDREYARKKKQAALAEIAINTAIGISKIWSQSGINIPLAIVSTALLTAAGLMQISAVNAAQMAQGGVVPSGYRNDTYPAMLTSGEVVVPPHKLNSIRGITGDSERKFKPVVFRIGHRELIGVLEEAEIVNKSF